MALIVAPQDAFDGPSDDNRFECDVIYVDHENTNLWVWIKEFPQDENLLVDAKPLIWVSKAGTEALPVPIAPLDAKFQYRGIARIVIAAKTWQQHCRNLSPADTIAAEIPSGTNLKDFVDNASPPNFAIVNAVVRQAVIRLAALLDRGSLADFLKDTSIGPALGTLPGFSEAMKTRPKLFAELATIVEEKRMVLLLSGRNGFLSEFCQGFKTYLGSPDLKAKEVVVAFQEDTFIKISNARFTGYLGPYAPLECLFATMAYLAERELKGLELHFRGSPESYALNFFKYPANHLGCVDHFLNYLQGMLNAKQKRKRITVFFPFDSIEVVMNGNEAVRQQLWEAMQALYMALPRFKRLKVGIVVSATGFPPQMAFDAAAVRSCALRVPALSSEELMALVASFLGHPPTPDEFGAVDRYTGGIPWFVYLVFCCAMRTKRGIVDACKMAENAIDHRIQSEPGTPEGFLVSELDLYRQELVPGFRSHMSAGLGSSAFFQRWVIPGERPPPDRPLNEQQVAWIDSGLMATEGLRHSRGESISSLVQYPAFRLSVAGTLPKKFADTVIMEARNLGTA